MELKKQWKSFGGWQRVFTHTSAATRSTMEFAVFEPEPIGNKPMPVVYFLSGLTCNWENCVTKGGVQKWASELGLIVVWPDTSPRGADIPDAPGQDDLGQGAGFYVNATQQPWATHYQMESYVRRELPELVEPQLRQFSGRRGIFGHSMGGHGALLFALKNPDFYHSVSAFSPIVSPIHAPWGQKAFAAYLGPDEQAWRDYDSCALIHERGCQLPLLVDVGENDPFIERELKLELLEQACVSNKVELKLRRHAEYDHSYYFIASFMADQLAFHAAQLRK